MSVNDQYYTEALGYLDKAGLASLTSKELLLDIYFMKFSIFKEKFQPQKAEAIFSEIVNRLLQYSDDAASRKKELLRISDKFEKGGLSNYAIKLKTAYASKIDKIGRAHV